MSTMTETLASYVPVLIAHRLATKPVPITEPTAEDFSAAVLFADISGFTALTERLAQQGPAGAEILTHELNTYFGQLIEIITTHGGDVVKFAGDALTAMWPLTESNGQTLPVVTQQAATCALAIQTTLQDYQTAEGLKLALSIGLGAGHIAAVHVGGVYGRWEFVITGPPLNQVNQAEAHAQPGQVVVSPEAWDLIQPHCTGQVLSEGHVRLMTVTEEARIALSAPPTLSSEVEASLRAYIPGAILARLAAGQSGWLAELRRITVLFINLPDLTYMTPLDQGQAAMQALQTALYRYEGSVNKISVDDKGATLVAALGLPPLAHEDDPIRGVQAALAMQATLSKTLNWHCAIGVTTGQAFCGAVGTETRREYTMMGDVVNLAARLMQAASKDLPGFADTSFRENLAGLEGTVPILCDQPTYQAAQALFNFTTFAPIQVKGKVQPISIFSPTGERSDAQAHIATRKSKIAIVGRTVEQMTLADKIQNLLRGRSSAVIIEGEGGIGKSQLVLNLLAQAQALGVNSLLGGGDAVEKATTYHAWGPIFRKIFNLIEMSDTHAAQQQVRERLSVLAPALVDHAPLLNAILPLNFPENDLTEPMQGKARAENTRALLVQVLRGAMQGEPLLLVMEDAHWLDSASWALLQQVKEKIQSLLLVIAIRPMIGAQPGAITLPDEYKQLLADPNTQHLQLAALPLKDTLTLVCQRLEVTTLPQPVATFILEKTEGHPFFSEELAYALRDAGLIDIADGECHLAVDIEDLRTLDFPDTLQGIITSRIDRLTPSQQLTLKVASVIGRIFALHILRGVHPLEADKLHLPDYLDTLERLELTPLETPEPELAYIFKHIITQEVAYNLMAFAQRRQLHQAIAEWYERTHAGELALFYPLLAHHWRRVVGDQRADPLLVSKAIDYLQKAGQQAVRSYANQEAVGFFSQALTLLKTLPDSPERVQQELDLQTALGPVLMATKGPGAPEVEKAYARARELCRQVGETPQLFPVLFGLWRFYLLRAALQTARELGEQLLTLAQHEQDPALLLEGHLALGGTLFWSGELVSAQEHLEQVIALYEPEQYRSHIFLFGQDPMMVCLSYMAFNLWVLGYPDQALTRIHDALVLAKKLAHPFSMAYTLYGAAMVHQLRREGDAAQERAEADITISTEQGFPYFLALSAILRGWALAEQGQVEEGIAQMRQGLTTWSATGSVVNQTYYLALLAEAHRKGGQAEEGLSVLAEALAVAHKNEELVFEAELHRLKGELLLMQGNAEAKVEAKFQHAIEVARSQQAKSLELRAAMSLSRLWRDQGKKEEARQILVEIYDWFTEGFDTADLQEAKALLKALS